MKSLIWNGPSKAFKITLTNGRDVEADYLSFPSYDEPKIVNTDDPSELTNYLEGAEATGFRMIEAYKSFEIDDEESVVRTVWVCFIIPVRSIAMITIRDIGDVYVQK